ncbi:MAG: InlB B-repeat-containing protein, partial [Methanosarcinales archaeon]|nr:InlB B-repeat-containing protein [Methanosarcinales archaeon]
MAAASPGTETLTVNWYEVGPDNVPVLIGSKTHEGMPGETLELNYMPINGDEIDYVSGKSSLNVPWSSYTIDYEKSDSTTAVFGETETVDFFLLTEGGGNLQIYSSSLINPPSSNGWDAEVYQVINKLDTSTNPATTVKEAVLVKRMPVSFSNGNVTIPVDLLDGLQINKDTTSHTNHLNGTSGNMTYLHNWTLNQTYSDGQNNYDPGLLCEFESDTGVLKYYYDPPNWQYEYDFDASALNTSRAIVYTSPGWYEVMAYHYYGEDRNLFNNSDIINVRLGADINQRDDRPNGTFYINRAKPSLTIDGAKDPNNPGTTKDDWYTFVQYFYAAPFTLDYSYIMRLDRDDGRGEVGSANAPLRGITWKNTFAIGGNGYGLVNSVDERNIFQAYENILYIGPQIIWNDFGIASVKDVEVIIEDPRYHSTIDFSQFNPEDTRVIQLNLNDNRARTSGYWGEFSEMHNLTMSGNVTVYKHNSNAEKSTVGVFQVWGADSTITIKEGANVHMYSRHASDAPADYHTPFVEGTYTYDFIIEDNVNFSYTNDQSFATGTAANSKSFTIGNNSTVSLFSHNQRNTTGYVDFSGSLKMGKWSIFNIERNRSLPTNQSVVAFRGPIQMDDRAVIVIRGNYMSPGLNVFPDANDYSMVRAGDISVSDGGEMYLINEGNGIVLYANNTVIDKLSTLHVVGKGLIADRAAASFRTLTVDRIESIIFKSDNAAGKALDIRENTANNVKMTNLETVKHWRSGTDVTYNESYVNDPFGDGSNGYLDIRQDPLHNWTQDKDNVNYGFNINGTVNNASEIFSSFTKGNYMPAAGADSDATLTGPAYSINESGNKSILMFEGFAGPYEVTLHWNDNPGAPNNGTVNSGLVRYGETVANDIPNLYDDSPSPTNHSDIWNQLMPEYLAADRTFDAWYTDPELTQAYNIYDTSNGGVTDKLTLYGKWTFHNVPITYHKNFGGSSDTSVTEICYNAVTPAKAADLFGVSGYTFTGWNTNSGGTGTAYQPGDSIGPVTAAVDLYAQWTMQQYNITYHNLLGASSPSKTTFTYADIGTALENPGARAGYDFGGWYAASDFSGAAVTSIASSGDKTYWAKWSENRSQTEQINVEYHLTNPVLDLPQYDTVLNVWVGGVTASEISIPGGFLLNRTHPALPAALTEFDASMTLDVYLDVDPSGAVSLTYDKNGAPESDIIGVWPVTSTNIAPYTQDHSLNNGTGFKRLGYDFVGWSAAAVTNPLTATETAPALLTAVDFATSDVTVYAVWRGDENGNAIQY